MSTQDKLVSLGCIAAHVIITLLMVPMFNQCGVNSLIFIVPVVTCTMTLIFVNTLDIIANP